MVPQATNDGNPTYIKFDFLSFLYHKSNLITQHDILSLKVTSQHSNVEVDWSSCTCPKIPLFSNPLIMTSGLVSRAEKALISHEACSSFTTVAQRSIFTFWRLIPLSKASLTS